MTKSELSLRSHTERSEREAESFLAHFAEGLRRSAYVLIQRLRAVEREHSQKRLSAIALTAYASAADRDRALAAGYDLHLTKPVGPSEITHAVAKFGKSLGA